MHCFDLQLFSKLPKQSLIYANVLTLDIKTIHMLIFMKFFSKSASQN